MSGLLAFFLWIVAAVFAVRTANAFFLREVKVDGVSYARAEAPADYWFALGGDALLVLGLVAILLLIRGEHRFMPAAFALVWTKQLAATLWSGEVSTWRGPCRRDEWPRRYWTEIGLYAGFVASGLLLLLLA